MAEKNTNNKKKRRLDSNRIALKAGESQRPNGTYCYRYRSRDGKVHAIYAKTLEELRDKEKKLCVDLYDGVRTDGATLTVNEMFDRWCELKRGHKDKTISNYKYMYNTYVRKSFGKVRIKDVKKSDVKRFYNLLANEHILSIATIDSVHTVLHQVFNLAVDDNYIRVNPSDNMLKELKLSHNFGVEKRKALTKAEQDLFLDFLKRNPKYNHWYPVFAVMVGTGMRVGETVGLRWCDIDLDKKYININHTLVYYNRGGCVGCNFAVNTPKTKSGCRDIPMFDFVKEAFLQEKAYQDETNISCKVSVDGYTDFIFVNRFGETQHQGTLNKAIRRIIRDCNDEVLLNHKGDGEPLLLPPFSCHTLRHTFATRLCEMEVYYKTIQDVLGHSDISVTMNIYADVTKEHKTTTFSNIENGFIISSSLNNA